MTDDEVNEHQRSVCLEVFEVEVWKLKLKGFKCKLAGLVVMAISIPATLAVYLLCC